VVDGTFAHYDWLIETATNLGVLVLAGSDETPAGELWREIELLARHGMSEDDALAAASTVP
jgi:imidazolonepropionase-like amidohydrolase